MDKRLSWIVAGVCLLSAAIAAETPPNKEPAAQAPALAEKWQTSTGRPFAKRIPDIKGLENFAQVAPGIYRGAQPAREGLAYLKEKGFKTVLSLRSWHSEAKDVAAAGLEMAALPVQADLFGSEPPAEKQIEAFFKIVLDPARQPVYFHCAHGKDRTGTLAALYRMEIDGWTAGEALEEMHAFGFHKIYKDLLSFVRDYKPHGYAPKPVAK